MAKKNEGGTETAERKKTECPMSLKEFAGGAEPLTITIFGKQFTAGVKAPFSTGSFGWNLNEKVTIDLGGKVLKVQIGGNFTVVGSKEAARE